MTACERCGNRKGRQASVNGTLLCKDCRRGTLTRSLRRRLRVVGPKRSIVPADCLDMARMSHSPDAEWAP